MADLDRQGAAAAVHAAVDAVLRGQTYAEAQAAGWLDEINEKAVEVVGGMAEGRKVISVANIYARTQAGIHSSAAAKWDSERDGAFTVRHDSASMLCVVQVFVC